MAGIYIHIPFCKQACYYCDFHFSTNQEKLEEIVNGIGTEIRLQKDYLAGEVISTIYFGGGTPSLVSQKNLNSILQSIHENFSVAPSPEITLEANPDDLTFEKLRELKEIGINRLSIGIQSFDDVILKTLNRAHDSGMAENCIHEARETGFNNISIDLIYALPGQGNDRWIQNINKALKLNPEHISSYALTIEEKTVFGRLASRGKMKGVDDDMAAEQLQILVAQLESESYEQYEVSNFSLPGYHSKHNSNYWKNKHYLGVGPSAHSYNGLSRQYNISNNHLYLSSLKTSKIPATCEILTREDKLNEYLLTSLRTAWGANLIFLREEFGFDLENTHEEYVRILKERRLATINNNTLVLTKTGFLLADKIASDFFVVKS